MKKLIRLISDLESRIHNHDMINPGISKSSVGWHIEHSLLVITMVIDELHKSTPSNYKWKFNLIKTLLLNLKKIPRGKAKAPKIVLPKNDLNVEILKEHLETAKIKTVSMSELESDKYFTHPFFGDMRLWETIKFLGIHTEHHLKIIDDIIKNSNNQ
jgi:hypothetical protein